MDAATLEDLIIKEIRKAVDISRRDLAEHLGIAKSTAGRRVDSMIARGIIVEAGVANRKEVGRPKRQLALRGDFGGYIGFDFDARFLYAVFINFAQETLGRRKIRLSIAPSRDEVIGLLRSLIDDLTASHSAIPLLGIGVGVPGPIRREARICVEYPYIENWQNVDLLEALDLSPEFLHIENNTRMIALGEYWLGPDAALRSLVCLSVRTGISAATIVNGALISGSHEIAGEIRRWTVPTSGSSTFEHIEKVGTVRAVTSGGSVDDAAWLEFLDSCRSREEHSLARLGDLARLHADAITRIIQFLDPQIVFLSGPFVELEDLYLDRVREATAFALSGSPFATPPIRPASLGEYAGALGAAAYAAAESKLVWRNRD